MILKAALTFLREYRRARKLADVRRSIHIARCVAFVASCSRYPWLAPGHRRRARAARWVREGRRAT